MWWMKRGILGLFGKWNSPQIKETFLPTEEEFLRGSLSSRGRLSWDWTLSDLRVTCFLSLCSRVFCRFFYLWLFLLLFLFWEVVFFFFGKVLLWFKTFINILFGFIDNWSFVFPCVCVLQSTCADLWTVGFIIIASRAFCCCHSASNSFATAGTIAHQAPSVQRISQARVLEWVAISFSRRSSQPRDRTHISCIVGGFFTIELRGKPSRDIAIIVFCLLANTFHFPESMTIISNYIHLFPNEQMSL